MTTRVLIVDDHPLLREGLRQLLAGESEFSVCGEADSVAGAIEAVARLQPDVLVLDLTLGGEDGIEVLRLLRERSSVVRVLILSMHDELLYAERLLALGAQGYLMKQESADEFLTALRCVVAGNLYLSPAASLHVQRAGETRDRPLAAAHERLTARECSVLQLVARGYGTQQIAAALSVSAKTVDSHRRNIREKLGLRGAGDLVRYAVHWSIPAAGPD